MATTITFEVPDDLTPDQAAELARVAKSHIAPFAYVPGGMAAELDRRIETSRINEASFSDAMEGKPPSTDLARRRFREALFCIPDAFSSLRGAWLNLGPEHQELCLIDDAAQEWPAIGTHRQQIAAVLADPMWSRKTARSAEIDGYMISAEMFVDQIAINPAHPPRDGVGEQFRNEFDMNFWWERPYVCQYEPDGKYIVECLNGGAWDRPTLIGFKDTLAEAVEVAKAYRDRHAE